MGYNMQADLEQERTRNCSGGKHPLEVVYFSLLSRFSISLLCLSVELDTVNGSLWTVEVCLCTSVHGGVKFHRKCSNIWGWFSFGFADFFFSFCHLWKPEFTFFCGSSFKEEICELSLY